MEPSLVLEAEDLSTPGNGVAVVDVIEDWDKRMKIFNYDAETKIREKIKHQLLELARVTIARRAEMPVFK
jgi:hypothetical protein